MHTQDISENETFVYALELLHQCLHLIKIELFMTSCLKQEVYIHNKQACSKICQDKYFCSKQKRQPRKGCHFSMQPCWTAV